MSFALLNLRIQYVYFSDPHTIIKHFSHCPHQMLDSKCKRRPELYGWITITFSSHCECICLFADQLKHKSCTFFPCERMPIPLISGSKVFGIDTVYQSRNIHLLPSVHSPANSCLRACRGPGLILEGFVWFVVLICMCVCEKMEDSCQCKDICLCHLIPSSIPVSLSLLPPLLSLSLGFPSPTLCRFFSVAILSHWAHKACKNG